MLHKQYFLSITAGMNEYFRQVQQSQYLNGLHKKADFLPNTIQQGKAK